MSRIRWSRWIPWSVVAVVLAIVVVSMSVRAQEDAREGVPPEAAHDPFTLYEAGLGAIAYPEMTRGPRAAIEIDPALAEEKGIALDVYAAATAERQEAVDEIGEWAEADNGPATAKAWSAYTDLMVEHARLQAAEYEAGLANIGDVGVAP